MEIRCRECNKLFRVSDDKITGIGIKFLCTRCGAYVKITREDFQQYTLSLTAASSPMPVASMSMPAAPDSETQTFASDGPVVQEVAPEEKPPLFVEPEKPASPVEAQTEPVVELMPEPLSPSLKAEPLDELQPEQPEPATRQEDLHESAVQPASLEPMPPAPDEPALSKQDTVEPAAPTEVYPEEQTVEEPAYSSTPTRSSRMPFALIGAVLLLGLAGYGVFRYLQEAPQSPQQKVEEATHEIISNEGLQIVNPSGAMDAKGDLLVTGVIENNTDKERNAWYVVIDVSNDQGAVLSKIRLLNGSQIYSTRDFEILAGRGQNVQELKTKILQDKGNVIPPRGRVNFEARYLQPPAGIASFSVQALPFDPVQLRAEIDGQISSTDTPTHDSAR